MNGKRPWRASESRPIRPFRVSPAALEHVGFRLRKDLEFSAEDPWVEIIETEEFKQANFSPEFDIDIDRETLTGDSGLETKDLALSIVLRDPAAWRSFQIKSWPIEDAPEQYTIANETLQTLSGARGIEFAIQICPSRGLTPQFRIASKPGQIISSRSFYVKVPEEGAGFPIELVDPAYIEQLGLPGETLWFIQWKSATDYDQPISEILSVLLNKEAGEKLLRVSSQDSLGNVLWREMAVEVFVEICLTIFSSEPDPPRDKDSLLGKMTFKLQQESGRDFDQLIAIAGDFATGSRFFRAHLQKGLQLSDRIKRISLAGRA